MNEVIFYSKFAGLKVPFSFSFLIPDILFQFEAGLMETSFEVWLLWQPVRVA